MFNISAICALISNIGVVAPFVYLLFQFDSKTQARFLCQMMILCLLVGMMVITISNVFFDMPTGFNIGQLVAYGLLCVGLSVFAFYRQKYTQII